MKKALYHFFFHVIHWLSFIFLVHCFLLRQFCVVPFCNSIVILLLLFVKIGEHMWQITPVTLPFDPLMDAALSRGEKAVINTPWKSLCTCRHLLSCTSMKDMAMTAICPVSGKFYFLPFQCSSISIVVKGFVLLLSLSWVWVMSLHLTVLNIEGCEWIK